MAKVTDVKQQTLGQSQDALAAILYKGTVTHKFPEVREPLRNGQGLEEKHLGTVRIHLGLSDLGVGWSEETYVRLGH